MLERTQPRDFWQSVTGSLGWFEGPRQAALREVKEETGLDARGQLIDFGVTNRFPIHEQWRTRYHPEVRWNTERVYGLLLPMNLSVRVNASEHIRYQWVPKEVAIKMASSTTNREAIIRFVGI